LHAVKNKLLVVDDDAEARGLLDYVLCGAGYEVTLASTGIEAVEKARQIGPDLVLLDIMLPDMDGFAVAELLRHQPATARAPVIMLSAYGGMSVQARGLECGVYRCLLKSVGVELILACVMEALLGRGSSAFRVSSSESAAQTGGAP
jgi:DNA-binding response OmpR family regulator